MHPPHGSKTHCLLSARSVGQCFCLLVRSFAQFYTHERVDFQSTCVLWILKIAHFRTADNDCGKLLVKTLQSLRGEKSFPRTLQRPALERSQSLCLTVVLWRLRFTFSSSQPALSSTPRALPRAPCTWWLGRLQAPRSLGPPCPVEPCRRPRAPSTPSPS